MKSKSQLQYQPFFYNQDISKTYLKEFRKAKKQKLLYQKTPENLKEVRAWIIDALANPESEYYFIYQKRKLIGHIGLRNINQAIKTAEIGTFLFTSYRQNKSLIKKTIKYVIALAKKRQLKMVLADIVAKDQLRIAAYEELNFKKDINQPNYLFLLI